VVDEGLEPEEDMHSKVVEDLPKVSGNTIRVMIFPATP